MAVKFSNYEEVYRKVVDGLFTDANVTYSIEDHQIKFSWIDDTKDRAIIDWLGHYAFTYDVLVDVTVSTRLLTTTYTKSRFRSFGDGKAVIWFSDEITREISFAEKLTHCHKCYKNSEISVEEFEDYKDVFEFLNAEISFSMNGVRVCIPPHMNCNGCKHIMMICSPNKFYLDSCVRNTDKHINTNICRHYERGPADKTCDTCKYQDDKGIMFNNCAKLNEEFYKTNCEDWGERV